MRVEIDGYDFDDYVFLCRAYHALTGEIEGADAWVSDMESAVVLVKDDDVPLMAFCCVQAGTNAEINHLYFEGAASKLRSAINCAGRWLKPRMRALGVQKVYTSIEVGHPKGAKLAALWGRLLNMQPELIRLCADASEWGDSKWESSLETCR